MCPAVEQNDADVTWWEDGPEVMLPPDRPFFNSTAEWPVASDILLFDPAPSGCRAAF